MKKIILALTLILSGCTMGDDGPCHEEYKPITARSENNCAVAESTVYLINGTPSLKYICNR